MAARDPVRWGVLGLAGITRRAIPGIDGAPNAQLVAVATQRPAAAEPLKAERPDLRVYHTYDDLLADPTIEAIYIPLPNTLHAEWTVRAAEHGKHVLCEKPLATTRAEVERMAEAAERHNIHLMEAFMWRFHPQHTRVKELLAAGAVGQPSLVRASLSFSIDRDKPNIRLTPELGGGVIWDVGCYVVSIARFLFDDEPETIRAAARVDPAFNVDLSLAALATFADGRMALLDASMERMRRSGYEIVGTTGSLRVERFWIDPDVPAPIVLHPDEGPASTEIIEPANHFVLEVEHFSDAVRGRVPLRYGPTDALAQSKALEAMQRAFTSGCAERP